MKTIPFILCLLMAFIGRGFGQSAESIIKAGDQLVVKISGVPTEDITAISNQYSVSNEGSVRLPHLTEIKAIGLNPTQLGRKLEQAYKSAEIFTNPTVSVSFGSGSTGVPSTQVVTVSGGVRAPGAAVWRADMTVMDCISERGGPTDFGKMDKIRLYRGSQVFNLNLKRYAPQNDQKVQAGDKIFVPE